MNDTRRLTIQMPPRLLEALDQKLTRPGESRSATIRRLLEAALSEEPQSKEIDRYLQGYREQPQTEEEFGWSDDVVKDSLAAAHWR
ncbi:MAG: ribbon-helix-helix protein, CopG family [Dehalococcoidia bacterium]